MRAAMVACRDGGNRQVGGVAARHIVAGFTVQYAPFGEVSNDLLGEEGVAGCPFGDLRDERGDRSISTQQLGGQRSRFRIIQRCKRNAVRAGQRVQRPAVFRSEGEQHQ